MKTLNWASTNLFVLLVMLLLSNSASGQFIKYLKAADSTTVKNSLLNGSNTWSGANQFTNSAMSGTATIGVGDSVQVTIANITVATGAAVVCYKGAQTAADTAATYTVSTAGKLSIFGKFAKVVAYWIVRL